MHATRTEADRFTLIGDLDDPALEPWIAGHARRLGLKAHIRHHDATELSVDVEGPPDLLDAMEAGCLLGPIGSWIESIRRAPLNRPAGGAVDAPDA